MFPGIVCQYLVDRIDTNYACSSLRMLFSGCLMLLFSPFSFSSYGLENIFREDLYKDFEDLTLEFYHKGNIYGLEKYW